MDPLIELGRRVLGHLPVWAKDEKALIKAEGGSEHSIRSYSVPDLTVRLAEDPESVITDEAGVTRPMTGPEVEHCLQTLAECGYASVEDGQWRMTEAGLTALVTPEEKVNQVPGAVTINTHSARISTDANLEVKA